MSRLFEGGTKGSTVFVLVEKYTSSDDMCGVETGLWVCDDTSCGMVKEEHAETYGTIF